ncbi:MAG: hypothetical protein B6241_05510 [Spirochaetaceae bacterium 4572_59]|nr:MAG: hypothetical protein B6241_05510 [Spirochaetaceae bacterium 4572_59]
MSELESTDQEKVNLPTVFQMDLSQREEFLSQIGSFTQEQRRIFHRICDFFDPMLDYNRFVLHAGKDILFANNQIEILMRKIRTAHYGLLKFKNDQGELKPDRIIICNRDSNVFYLNVIEDEIQRMMLDNSQPFLSLDSMAKNMLKIPYDLVETIYPDSLSPLSFKNMKDDEKIITISLKTGGSILLSSASSEFLIEISRNKIKNALKNSSFISILSRYMEIKISDIQKKQFSRDMIFWKNASTQIVKNKDDLQLRIKHLSLSILQSAEILHFYLTNAEAEEEKEREESKEKHNAISEICMEILKKENLLVTAGELLDLLDPYEKKWLGFKDLFYETVVKVNQKIGLPVILFIGENYLHRDHIYPFFRLELSMQSKDLRFHYIEIMERMLRTRNKDKVTIFYTRDSFKDDVLDQIRENSPILSEFLSKPRIVSEGIVHYFRELKKVRDVNKIKDFMNNFFEDGMIRFKDADYLLNLYLLDIFNESYKYLSWWKKFTLKISGRHESFINQFTGIGEDVPGLSEKIIELNKSRQEALFNGASSPRDKSANRRKYDSTGKTVSRRRQSASDRSMKYNLKQRNKAWDEFQEAFDKKK